MRNTASSASSERFCRSDGLRKSPALANVVFLEEFSEERVCDDVRFGGFNLHVQQFVGVGITSVHKGNSWVAIKVDLADTTGEGILLQWVDSLGIRGLPPMHDNNDPVTQYGIWPSPITAGMVASAGITVGHVALDGDAVYCREERPTEDGRGVIVRNDRAATAGDIRDANEDVIPDEFDVRTLVYEYEGGTSPFAPTGSTSPGTTTSASTDNRSTVIRNPSPPIPRRRGASGTPISR
jgi:hypothetical protein